MLKALYFIDRYLVLTLLGFIYIQWFPIYLAHPSPERFFETPPTAATKVIVPGFSEKVASSKLHRHSSGRASEIQSAVWLVNSLNIRQVDSSRHI